MFHRHRQLEQQFFTSLTNLCNFYKWPVPQPQQEPFPYSVAAAFGQISKRFSGDTSCIIAQRRGCRAALATLHAFDTGNTLFYIPIRPLHHLLSSPQGRAEALVILSLFNYLHNIVGIPYLGDYSYIKSIYRMIEDCLYESYEDEDDDEKQYRQRQQEEVLELLSHAESLEPLIYQPFKLRELKKAIASYAASAPPDKELLQLAHAFLSLARKYPNHNLFKNSRRSLLGEDDHEIIFMESYLSFYWSSSISFEDFFYDTIESDLQERIYKQEPTYIRWFDRPDPGPVDFNFEVLFFPLLERLINFLEQKDKCYE